MSGVFHEASVARLMAESLCWGGIMSGVFHEASVGAGTASPLPGINSPAASSRRSRGLSISYAAVLAVLLILALEICWQSSPAFAGDTTASDGTTTKTAAGIHEDFVSGRVKSVSLASIDERLLKSTGMISRRQLAEVEVEEGRYRGATFLTTNEVTDNPAYNITVRPGQEVILSVVTTDGGAPEVNISDYKREHVLLWLLAAFLAVFLIFGGRQGLKSLAGLVICIALISLVLLPLSLKGVNPLMSATLICLGSTVATMLFSAGLSRKAAAGALGTVAGVLAAGLAAQIVIHFAPLVGLSSEEAQILRSTMMSQPQQFWSGLLAAGMLIGSLGVIMDVGISIASSVWEVSRSDTTLGIKKLYKSGMNVGRDIMGTMTTTLVLAYTGSALPLLLLAAQMPSTKLINLDLVATEITAALAGSLGLTVTIPVTAYVAARLMAGQQRSPRVTRRELEALGAGANASRNDV